MRSLLLTGFILLFSTGAFPQGSSSPNGLVAFETLTLAPAADAMQADVLAGVMTTDTVLFATVSAPLSHNLGIAIVNPGAIPANVTMTLRLASDGTAISVKTLAIRARQQVANFIGEFFAGVPEFPADFDGSLSIISDNPVAILAMRFLGTNFSTIPITSLSSPATVPQIDTGVGGPGAVILPQFATGGSWSSEIVVLNTTARALAVRVDLFKQDGTPLTASFNGQSGSSLQNRVVRANSVLIERTDNTGILQVGYAIVTPIDTIAGTVVPTPTLTVTSTDPSNGATGVTPKKNIVAAFSEVMNPLTFTPLTFTVKQGLIPITGAVTYTGLAATFSPLSNLEAGLTYTATITTGAKDSAGNALSNNFVWSFTTDNAINTIAPPVVAKVSLVTSLNLAGSFVSPQSVYADSDRIYLGSYQGYLFVARSSQEFHQIVSLCTD
jgi:Bacterial Ig-like domain